MTEEELEQMVTGMIDKDKKDWVCDMYCDYCKELAQYDDEHYPEGRDGEVYHKYLLTGGVEVSRIEKCGEKVGFLITMVKPYDKSTLFICEAYVKPEYRNRGYMRKAFKESIRAGYTMIRFCVFKENPAVKVWQKLLQEAGYKCVARTDLSRCLQEYFYVKAV